MFALLAALVFIIGAVVALFTPFEMSVVAFILFLGLGLWALHVAFPIRIHPR